MQWSFGLFRLDMASATLWRGEERVPIRPKAFDVLVHLVSHAGELVSKERLLATVWPDVTVGDAVLKVRIRELRRVLGETAQTASSIETVPRRGYRFIAPVQLLSPLSPPQPTPHAPEPPTSAEAHTEHQEVPEHLMRGDRKLVTVLHIAPVHDAESVAPIELDDLHRVMRGLYDAVEQAISAYDGTLLHVGSDHILAVFGIPVVQEDHARRAVFAALMLREINAQRDTSGAATDAIFGVRIGMHTGYVAVGGIGDGPEAMTRVIGEPVLMAQTLQEAGAPHTIVCSDATARLIQDQVQLEAFSLPQPTHRTALIKAYAIVGRSAPERSRSSPTSRFLSRFVGRASELTILFDLLAEVEEGRGQVVGIVGEPGMGKSRLLYECHQRLLAQASPVTYVEGHCLSYGQATPYLPILDILRQLCHLRDDDEPERITSNIHQCLSAAAMDVGTWAPYLLHLLGVPVFGDQLVNQTPQMMKSKTFEALCQLFLQASHRQPLVMAIENLHWIDATSQDLLASLIEQVSGASLLLILTYRPGYRPPWIDKSYATQLSLLQLTRPDSLAVVESVAPLDLIPEELVDALVSKAGGNPFFLEELAQTLIERGMPVAPLAIPDTIHAVLAARIDRIAHLPKRLLQTAAVIGMEAPLKWLEMLMDLPEGDLRTHFQILQSGEFLYENATAPIPSFVFKHALTRDVAYQSLLLNIRQDIHGHLAALLAERFPDIVATQPEVLAHHYTASGDMTQAIPSWQQAGQQARHREAHREAMHHFTTGLELLSGLPDSPSRRRQELALRIGLGPAVVATKGYCASEVRETFERARELSQQVGDPIQHFAVLLGLAVHYIPRSELATAQKIAEEILRLAQQQNNPLFRVGAHLALMGVACYLGQFDTAQEQAECCIAVYEPKQHQDFLTWFGQDPAISANTWLAWVLWLQGYLDQARQRMSAAISDAQVQAHPFTLARGLTYAATLAYFTRNVSRMQEQAARAVHLSRE